MTSPGSELPADVERCHALIARLRMELRAANERIEELQPAAAKAREAAARIANLERLLAEQQETIADQQQTIESLAADNALLKRSLFGSRRERFTDDPTQTLLFATLEDPPAPDEEQKPPRRKRTSRGRQRRVFPEFLEREERLLLLDPEQIPEELRDNPNVRRFFKKVGESLELTPMRLKVIEQLQEVIALDQPDETTTMVAAKRPATLINSFAEPSLLAHLTVSRLPITCLTTAWKTSWGEAAFGSTAARNGVGCVVWRAA